MATKKKRHISPSYPFYSLKTCVDYVDKLHKSAGQAEVTKDNALKYMGLDPTKPSTTRVYAAMANFGLIAEGRSGQTKNITVTNLARKILLVKGESASIKISSLQAAASNYEIMRDLRTRWPDGLPDDDNILRVLNAEHNFTARAAKSFLPSLIETYDYAKLGGHDMMSEEMASNELLKEDITEIKMSSIKAPAGYKVSKITLAGGKEVILQSPSKMNKNEFEFMMLWINQLDLIEDTKSNNNEENDKLQF